MHTSKEQKCMHKESTGGRAVKKNMVQAKIKGREKCEEKNLSV